MLKLHSFVKAGDSTACAPIKFVSQMRAQLEMFQDFASDEAFQQHLYRMIEPVDRWEYVVINEVGETLAVMAIAIEPYDYDKGEPVIQTLLAGSLQPGLLKDAYKMMRDLARERGIRWAVFTRTNGQRKEFSYKKIDLGQR